jgi:hypothetical protein
MGLLLASDRGEFRFRGCSGRSPLDDLDSDFADQQVPSGVSADARRGPEHCSHLYLASDSQPVPTSAGQRSPGERPAIRITGYRQPTASPPAPSARGAYRGKA